MTTETTSTTYRLSIELPATPDRVFAALISPDDLRAWFAEQVEIEPRVGGAYRFWGRHTLYGGDRRSADQAITQFDQDRCLAFTWTWNDRRTDVRIALSASAEGTVVELTHVFEAPFDHPECGAIVEDFWRLAFGNLRSMLEHGEPALQPVYGDPGPMVRLSIVVAAPPSAVFAALTDPKQMDQWLSRSASSEPKEGGAYSYGWTVETASGAAPGGPSRILEIIPDRLLVHDWSWPGDGETTVRWELQPEGDGTRITLTHATFDKTVDTRLYTQGWCMFLIKLQSHQAGAR